MNQYTPSAAPAPAGWVDAIWRAVQAKRLTWPEAQHLQDIALPRCLKHDRPIKTLDGGGWCELCVEELYSGTEQ
jgi:hypothetical protein